MSSSTKGETAEIDPSTDKTPSVPRKTFKWEWDMTLWYYVKKWRNRNVDRH